MPAKVRITIDERALQRIARGPEGRRLMADVGRQLAARERAVTPKHTGAGAASIKPEEQTIHGDPGVTVGWDADHGYLTFPEYGTAHQAEQRFTRTLLDRYTFN